MVFVYHILVLRYLKINIDCVNAMYKWRRLGARVNLNVIKNILGRLNINVVTKTVR